MHFCQSFTRIAQAKRAKNDVKGKKKPFSGHFWPRAVKIPSSSAEEERGRGKNKRKMLMRPGDYSPPTGKIRKKAFFTTNFTVKTTHLRGKIERGRFFEEGNCAILAKN